MTRLQWELIEMRRNVALAKVNILHEEAQRLADLVRRGVADQGPVIDALWDTASANKLIAIHGVDFLQELFADAFEQPQPAPLWLRAVA